MKNTAPPRALRGQGFTGAAPPTALGEGGAGGMSPRQKDSCQRAFGTLGAWANYVVLTT